ncbi:MAG: hypothetical protein JXA03_09260 [Bacteroidales bacterium]|nr:hypothetical protein [Bacteroidales bacterium]
MKKIVLFLLVLCFQNGYSQVIPDWRRVNWTGAGLRGEVEYPVQTVNVTDFGATGNGTTNDHAAIMSAINSLPGQCRIVYFPPGTYLINAAINLPDSVILRGAPNNQSTIKCNMGGTNIYGLIVHGVAPSSYEPVLQGYVKWSYKIVVANPANYAPGDYIEIRQDNGSWDTNPATWAEHAMGQIVRVHFLKGDTLVLDESIRIDYSASLNPEVGKFTPRKYVGIESLKIQRIDDYPSGGPNNISIYYADNCWVAGIESDKSVGSHIVIRNSNHIEVTGSYFHDAFSYDGASNHGYGVTLNNHCGFCLVENNIFKHLRHAMMVKVGANGNVFGYNYSLDVYRTEWPNNYSGDISLHGHYSFVNLFEGNIVQNIIIDHAWGPSGPFNTFFRNRAELYGIIITSGTQTTSSQNFVGNEVTNTQAFMGQYSLAGSDHFEYGNNIKGTIIPSGTGALADQSYYYSSKPPFWDVNMNWPNIGVPNPINTGTIQAKLRYQNNHYTYIMPVADAGFDVIIFEGGSTTLNGSVYGGIEPFYVQWSPTTGLNNPNILTPTASPAVTTMYTLTLKDNYGVVCSDQVVVFVQVYPQIEMNLKAYLEGPFDQTNMATDLNSQGIIPLAQPYNKPPWNYAGTESVASIPNADVVDWILVELRETTGSVYTAISDSVVGRKACFLIKNGNIRALDGISNPVFDIVVNDNLYAVLWHRNHLGIMSSTPLTASGNLYSYNFSDSKFKVFGAGLAHKEVAPGVWGMTGGDGDSDSQVTNGDKNGVWVGQSGNAGYMNGDFNCDGQVNNTDKNDIWTPNGGLGSQVPD